MRKRLAQDGITGYFLRPNADVAQLIEQLIRNSRERLCTGFHWLAHRCRRGRFSLFRFAPRYAELRRFAAKSFRAVENNRERILARARLERDGQPQPDCREVLQASVDESAGRIVNEAWEVIIRR